MRCNYDTRKKPIGKRMKKLVHRTNKRVRNYCSLHQCYHPHCELGYRIENTYEWKFIHRRIITREDAIKYKKLSLKEVNNNFEIHFCSRYLHSNSPYEDFHGSKQKKSKKKSNRRFSLKDNYIKPKIKKTNIHGEDENCAICLESMKGRLIEKLRCCKHSFCKKCYIELVETIPRSKYYYYKINYDVKCPLCRTNIYQRSRPYSDEED